MAQKSLDSPKRRPLKIYVSDPMVGRNSGNISIVDVENESVGPGPTGERIVVVDYNSHTDEYYRPVDLDQANILMQGGLLPSEADPRFHQQMVYAVAMRTLENFDRALGRRISLWKSRKSPKLRLLPHAFYGANAFYDSELHAVVFGYFRADNTEPGANLPGQMVFTCLSHDIVAHEVTHAVIHRLKRFFLEPSNVDVLAFHEAFSDLVALFQHFSLVDVVKQQIQRTGYNLRNAEELVSIATQFGHATSSGSALRSALMGGKVVGLSDDIVQPHDRGLILVAAVFDAFVRTYEKSTLDLVRLTGSIDIDGRSLHPDLVSRLAVAASKAAQTYLTMCIRAIDYLPPVDVTFGDFLRALVTADIETSSDDQFGYRAELIEAFRIRSIYPIGVVSLAAESLVWETASEDLPQLQWDAGELLDVIADAAKTVSAEIGEAFSAKTINKDKKSFRHYSSSNESRDLPNSDSDGDSLSPSAKQYSVDESSFQGKIGSESYQTELSRNLHKYALENASALGLDANIPIQAMGVHPAFRVASNGKLAIELIAQLAQKRDDAEDGGGLSDRGGTTLIVDFAGRVRYVIAKPLPGDHLSQTEKVLAQARVDRQKAFLAVSDREDPLTPYLTDKEFKMRALIRANLSNLHSVR